MRVVKWVAAWAAMLGLHLVGGKVALRDFQTAKKMVALRVG